MRESRSFVLVPENEDLLSPLLEAVSVPVAKKILAHTHEAGDSRAELIGPTQSPIGMCSCPFFIQWRLPCRHIISYHLDEGLSMEHLLHGSRWHLNHVSLRPQVVQPSDVTQASSSTTES